MVLFGEQALSRALAEYVKHFHEERNHQGLGNALLFPSPAPLPRNGGVRRRERLGGMLKYYYREAA